MEDIRHPETDETVLHAAIKLDLTDFASFLIGVGNETFAQAHYIVKHSGVEGIKTALHLATEKGNVQLAVTLLTKVYGKQKKLAFIKQETAVDIQGQRPRLLSCLHLAAYFGHTELVKMYLDEGLDVNHMNGKKDTALLWAARWGHDDTVTLLLDRGADPEIKNDKGSTALYWAIRYQHESTVELLLTKGKANPNTTRKLGLVAPIVIAAAYGNIKICQALARHPDTQINLKIRGGDTAIHNAAKEGHLDVVLLLYSKGAYFDEKDEVGDTPMLLAAKNGHVKVVNALLKRNADINARNHEGFDVWYYAIENESMALLNTLLSGFRGVGRVKRNPICIAASRGRCDKVRFIINLGNEPTDADAEGNTFLHHAATHDQHGVIEEFHSVISLQTQNHNGNTPLHIACAKGFSKTITALLNCKAKADITNKNGETALHVAAHSSKISRTIVKTLVEYMIKSHDWNSLNLKDKTGNNCLHVAAKFAPPDVLWEFRFVKINERDRDGLTPLHNSVRSGHPEILLTMMDIFESVKRDASINEQSFTNKETVLHLAAEAGHAKCVKRLIGLGADVSLQDINGDTVLHRLIHLCVHDERNIVQHLETFDAILKCLVRWWCIKNSLSFPEHDTDALAIIYNRDAVRYITSGVVNNDGLSVLGQAFKYSVPGVLQRLLMYENVTMFDEEIYTFDVTGVTPETNNHAQKLCSGSQIAPSEETTQDDMDVSGLELLITNSSKQHAAEVLDLPPIKMIENHYTNIVAWTFALLMIVHIIYMSLFTYIGVEMCKKLRDNPGDINSTDSTTVLLYVIVPLEPAVVTIFNIYRLVRYCVKGDRRWKARAKSIKGVRIVPALIGSYGFFIVCLVFSVLVFVWIGLFTERYEYQDYVLAAAVCMGWLLTISFTRGVRAIHYFYRMLMSIILRDILRFLVVYTFVIVAFGFAFHVLFQASTATVDDYPTPADTLFLTFNMMIGMGELFDGTFEQNMAAVNRSATYAKVLYLFYIILSTIVMLNLLIAMMNDSYSMVLQENTVMWRIESVSMGVEIEESFPVAKHFSKIKIVQGMQKYTYTNSSNVIVLRKFIMPRL